ncbi:MAG: hypothetical protein ACQET7_12170 [Thermodesulfobacteriota bacterium]
MQLRKYSAHIVLSLTIITLAQLGLAFKGGVFSGHLVDPDCYTWLTRVVQLQETGQWFDAILHRVDPPYGLEQHWTRPFDILLLAGAWILTPFAGFEKALHAWGVVVSPLLHIAAALSLVWAFISVYNNRQLLFLALCFIVQPAIFVSFQAGRPDHHGLIIFLFVVSLGFIVRMMQHPARRMWPWAAGFVSALGFWVCIEFGVFVILPIIIFFSILWFLKEKNVGSTLFNYSASLLLFSTIALLIQNGWSKFLRPEVDRISIIFILFFFLVFLYAFFVQRYGFSDKTLFKVLFSGAAGICTLAIMLAVYPQLFWGIEIDPLYKQIRTPFLGQKKSIFKTEWPGGVIWFLYWIGIIIPTFLWFVYILIKKKWWQDLVNKISDNIPIKLSIFVIVCFFIYASRVTYLRFIAYLEIICLLGYVVFMDNIVKFIESRLAASKLLYLLRPLAIVIILNWFYYPTIMYSISGEGKGDHYDINIVTTSKYINDISSSEEKNFNIMAAPELGSPILYRTKNNVYTIANHRCKNGFKDWYHMMTAETDGQAHFIAKKRGVDLILINQPLDKFYFRNQEKNVFFDRLLTEREPQWLDRVEVPDDVPKDILIYRVVQRNDY